MAVDNGAGKPIRKVIPITLMLLILGIFLSIYFFKYIPDQQLTLNKRGFLELQQIQNALLKKKTGYEKAIQIYLQNPAAYSHLPASFSITPPWPDSLLQPGVTRKLAGTAIVRNNDSNAIYLTYLLKCGQPPNATAKIKVDSKEKVSPNKNVPPNKQDSFYMSIGVEKVLAPIISTYKDLFEDYLLIVDSTANSANFDTDFYSIPHRGEILYNSGNLPIDYPVNMDSLIRTRDGFSLLNIHNVTVEGNAYKLFLYPIQWGSQQMVLAGLVPIAQYNEGLKNIPFALVALPGIIILLLLIHLPVLKIYLIGIYERVTDMDIRLLIGTYFVAAFAAFFLFSWLFLVKVQKVTNEKNLEMLSQKLGNAFHDEIDSIRYQLIHTDSVYAESIGGDKKLQRILRFGPNHQAGLQNYGQYTSSYKQDSVDSCKLESILRPVIYPYPDNIFMVDDTAKLVGAWNGIIQSGAPNLFSLKDRQYFRDFKDGRSLADSLRLFRDSMPFDTLVHYNIQPVLSRLDGEYAINLVIKSNRSWNLPNITFGKNNRLVEDTVHRPWLIGLSTKMHSVSNTQFPAGYNFSIIDENGNVLYDSKPGRALLSNFLTGSDAASAIRECAVYRNRRFFDETNLDGRKTAMLVTPIQGMPYTLITYYNLENRDEFEFHLIGLSSLFTGAIILLILFSTVINEWNRKKVRLVLSPDDHFEWLQPTPKKEGYYRFLISGMLFLLGIYALAWMVLEIVSGESDFCLFFITLLFPFNIAIYYYRLRQAYYLSSGNPAGKNSTERIGGVMFFLITLIGLVLLFYVFGESKLFSWHSLILALVQIFWISEIKRQLRIFREFEENKKKPVDKNAAFDVNGKNGPTSPDNKKTKRFVPQFIWAFIHSKWKAFLDFCVHRLDRSRSYLNYYSLAIVCGVCMISLVPACGIFWLLNRQETTLRLNSERLETIRAADARRASINNALADHKNFALDSSCALEIGPCHDLKFHNGLYMLHDDAVWPNKQLKGHGAPSSALSFHYILWHQLFFPEDSSVMAWTQTPLSATDDSWGFSGLDDSLRPGPWLIYNTQKDGMDSEPFRLCLGREASRPTFSLIFAETVSTGMSFFILYFLGQLMSIFLSIILTRSLARRIFLINLYHEDASPETTVTGLDPSSSDDNILEALGTNEQEYRKWWGLLSPVEKFILFDLAKDGFTNYRTAWILYKLKKAGRLQFKGGILQFTDFGFREFVLHQSGNKDVQSFLSLAQQAGTWQSFRMPLMILFATFGLFIFFTQDALYQKISGLIATFISIRPMLSSLFPKGNNDRADLDTSLAADTTQASTNPPDAATPSKDPPASR